MLFVTVQARTRCLMRNIELKARLLDLEHGVEICEALGALAQGDIHQIDTYFGVERGRLKLREADPGHTELIYYERADTVGPKGCDYLLYPVDGGIKEFLGAALGIVAHVDKVRTLYLWKNVRIHLDRVAGLGDFIEFEAVLDGAHDDEDGQAKLDYLLAQFGITAEQHVACSYLDLSLNHD